MISEYARRTTYRAGATTDQYERFVDFKRRIGLTDAEFLNDDVGSVLTQHAILFQIRGETRGIHVVRIRRVVDFRRFLSRELHVEAFVRCRYSVVQLFNRLDINNCG